MSYRIATWNLDHASRSNRPIPAQMEEMQRINADILVLTETCKKVNLSSRYPFSVASKPNKYGKHYSTIWSKWQITKPIDTYDGETSTCALVDGPLGNVLVYGTIIAYHGFKAKESGTWVEHHKEIGLCGDDWFRIQQDFPGIPLIVAGDFNQTRDGSRKYCSSQSIELLDKQIERNNLVCLTEEDFGKAGKLNIDKNKGRYRQNVDHICISKDRFLVDYVGAWDHFTASQELSDHNGVYVDISVRS